MTLRNAALSSGLLLLLSSSALVGCGGKEADSCEEGAEGCACYPNKTCNDDLQCLSKLCVDPDGKDDDDDNKDDDDKDKDAGTNKDGSTGDDESDDSDGSDDEADDADGSDDSSDVNPDDADDSGDVNPSTSDVNPDDADDTTNDTTNDVDPGVSPGVSPGGAPEGSPVAEHGQLSVVGTNLVDSSGAAVQLKGVSSMWLNWEEDGYAEDLDGLIYMRDNWNLSLIRVAMGVEATDSSPTYLADPTHAKAQVEKIVDNAITAGVYVIIDWHDHEAIDHQAQSQAFFSEMATKYGDKPNVLYEVFNEPDHGSETDSSALWETWSDLKPHHEVMRDTIRAIDSDNVIIFGTPSWDQDVDAAAANPLSGSNQMYTFHFYACDHTRAYFQAKVDGALSLGLPLFVTEWGAATADGVTTDSSCITEAGGWHDWMDAHSISWAAWKFDNCADATCFFVDDAVPTDGNWTEAQLNGLHPQFAIERMKRVPEVVVNPVNPVNPVTPVNPTGCEPSGTCAEGNAMDCDDEGEPIERDCAACALLPDTACGGVTYFGAVSQPTFSIQPTLVSGFSSSADVAVLDMSFDFATFATAYEEIGVIAFELAASYAVDPVYFETCIETTDAAHMQVSLESGDSGCVYPLYVAAFDEVRGCRPAYIQDPSYDGSCWQLWEGQTLPGAVSQINVRLGSYTSGTGTLAVYSVTW